MFGECEPQLIAHQLQVVGHLPGGHRLTRLVIHQPDRRRAVRETPALEAVDTAGEPDGQILPHAFGQPPTSSPIIAMSSSVPIASIPGNAL